MSACIFALKSINNSGPDGESVFGCCSDCVLDDELNCQSISSCPNNCANTVCDEENEEWCIEDLLAGPQC